jgi:hypothetical protein
MFDYFYNGSIRKLVVAFGSLFDEIFVEHEYPDATKKRIKVPISYGPKEKFYRRVIELDEAGDRDTVENILPRIGFEITGMQYDGGRKLNTLNKTTSPKNDLDQTLSNTYHQVPYNIQFTLNIMTRNIEDGHQIVEQILPNFTPDFTITMNFTELDKKIDVPIILNSVNATEEYEGDMMTRRMVTHTLSFTAKSFVFGRIRTSGIIREVRLTFQELMSEP